LCEGNPISSRLGDRRKKFRSAFYGLFLLSLGISACQSEQAAGPDLIVYNAKVYTVDEDKSIHQAVAITDGEISAVGTSEDILSSKTTSTISLDVISARA